MKTPIRVEPLAGGPNAVSPVLWTVCALVVSWALTAAAQESSATANPPTTAVQQPQGPATNQPAGEPVSGGVGDIVRMADAGVSVEVIKTYVETSPTAFQPTEADIIALKKHNVPNEIATLLLKRGAQARTVLAKSRSDALDHALSTKRLTSGGLDPESYDYFRYYYLQPRAMASAYQRLSPYYLYPLRPSYRYRHIHGLGPLY